MQIRQMLTLAAVLATYVAAPPTADAQVLIRGQVVGDEDEQAVADAEVELLDSRGRRISSTLADRERVF